MCAMILQRTCKSREMFKFQLQTDEDFPMHLSQHFWFNPVILVLTGNNCVIYIFPQLTQTQRKVTADNFEAKKYFLQSWHKILSNLRKLLVPYEDKLFPD